MEIIILFIKLVKFYFLFQIVVINTKQNLLFSEKTSSCNNKIQDNLLLFYAQVTYDMYNKLKILVRM
jgi:hypothetical protein